MALQPKRAEEMLQPELFDLGDFAKLYHGISRLLDCKRQPLDEATTTNLMRLQERLNAWTRVAYDTALTEAGLLFHPSGMRSSSAKGEQLRSCLRPVNVLRFRSYLAAKEPGLLGPDKPELPPLHTRPAGLASLVKACPELAPELVDALALSL